MPTESSLKLTDAQSRVLFGNHQDQEPARFDDAFADLQKLLAFARKCGQKIFRA